jgi:hypothetical protein
MQVLYKISTCLSLCESLQRQYIRWGKELTIGELMRMAVQGDPSESMAFALCRMLFTSKDGTPLRPPGLGEPWFLGDTSAEDWPLEPIHLHEDCPLFVVRGWVVGGVA